MIRAIKRALEEDKRNRNFITIGEPLPELRVDDKVVVQSDGGWNRKGKIVKVGEEPRSYLVDTGQNILRRNRVHLRKDYGAYRNIPVIDSSEDEVVKEEEKNIQASDSVLENNNETESESNNNNNEDSSEQTQSDLNICSRRSVRNRKVLRDPDFEYYK